MRKPNGIEPEHRDGSGWRSRSLLLSPPAPDGGEICARPKQTLSRCMPAKRRPIGAGLDRACARATLPLSGAGGMLNPDAKADALIVLRLLREILLLCNSLLWVECRYVGCLMGYTSGGPPEGSPAQINRGRSRRHKKNRKSRVDPR